MSFDYGLSIAETFKEYLKTGNSRLIEQYSVMELKKAVSLLSPYYNNNRLWYRMLEQRIDELNQDRELERIRKQKELKQSRGQWIDRLVSYSLGVLTGFLFCLL